MVHTRDGRSPLHIDDLDPLHAFINSSGTYQLTTRPTRLLSIVYNERGTSASLSIYNGAVAAENLVAAIEMASITGRSQHNRDFDIQLSDGLTLVVADSPAFTVTYL